MYALIAIIFQSVQSKFTKFSPHHPHINREEDPPVTFSDSQFIINGVMQTLKYYLRLLENTDKFLDNYSKNVISDGSLKFEHKNYLQKLLTQEALKE